MLDYGFNCHYRLRFFSPSVLFLFVLRKDCVTRGFPLFDDSCVRASTGFLCVFSFPDGLGRGSKVDYCAPAPFLILFFCFFFFLFFFFFPFFFFFFFFCLCPVSVHKSGAGRPVMGMVAFYWIFPSFLPDFGQDTCLASFIWQD